MADMQIIQVENGGEIEAGEEWCRKVEDDFTPYVDQKFASIEEAVKFYNIYALACGFDVRKYTTKKWRDGTIKSKLLVCNREGSYTPRHNLKDMNGESSTITNPTVEDVLGSPKRRCRLTKIGCKARIRLQMKDKVVVVDCFNDTHNHELIDVKDREFQKLSNELSLYHKQMILNNSRIAVGATRTYNMAKEQVKGFQNVGAGLHKFKNFQKDVKCFINERDGQFFIDHFMSMLENREDFYFDYECDEDNSLTRAIWADSTAIRNYSLFGDAVSYDPTYRTNKYSMVFTPFTGVDHHKHSVTFCGALIAKEDYESFNWVFSRFLKAMKGKEPEYIITDQDPGIIKSVSLIFKTARHRFCMWHIMNKVPVKFGSSRKDYSEFIKNLNAIIWDDEIEPDDFDSKWKELMRKHEVDNDDWFTEMYTIRSQWVMAYCRNLKMGGVMRTTQRSESENSFFKKFVNKSSTLVEFWMRFESAMDKQRYTQKRLDHESKHSRHTKISNLGIEDHGARVYTNEVFLCFQEEVHYSMMSCSVRGFMVEDGWEITKVADSLRNKTFDVMCKQGTCEAVCTCKMFESVGLLCRHIIWIYSGRGIRKIPDEYIVKRWTKNALRGTDAEANIDIIDGKQIRMTKLLSEFHNTIGVLKSRDMADIDKLCTLIREFRLEINPECEPPTKQQELEQLLGCKANGEITIQPPKQSKNKGSGKRIISSKAKAVMKAKKQPRLCALCKQMSHHDSRNCPLNKSAKKNTQRQPSSEKEGQKR